MFERDKRRLYRHELDKCKDKAEVLDELFGNYYNDYYSNYNVYVYLENKKTIWNRLNLLWILPIWLLSIPFQWLFLGKVGVKSSSWLGNILFKLTGER